MKHLHSAWSKKRKKQKLLRKLFAQRAVVLTSSGGGRKPRYTQGPNMTVAEDELFFAVYSFTPVLHSPVTNATCDCVLHPVPFTTRKE
jgi:hypothetical protein